MPVRPSPGATVNGSYRIILSGVVSERFCRPFAGMSHHIDGRRTVLEGVPGDGRAIDDVLAALANLGVDVVAVERPAPHPRITDEEAR
jgi:hypothetical protein